MKKNILIALSLLLLLSGCAKPEEEIPQATNAPVETSVQTGTEEQATDAPTAAPTEDVSQEAEGETQTPNKTGSAYRLVRTTVLDGSGNESWHQEYSYDDYGREKLTEQYMEGTITYTASTVYTSDTVYETTIQRYDTTLSIRYVCDDQGRVTRQETLDEGVMIDYTEYTYDAYGNNLTLHTVTTEGEETKFDYEYAYDEAGRITLRKEFLNGELVGQLECTYDENGREASSRYTYPDGTVSYTTATTWSGSTATQVSTDGEGYDYMKLVTSYDETGNILSQEAWQDGMLLSTTEYIYEDIEIIG